MRLGRCAWERNYVCLAIWILYRMSVLGGLHKTEKKLKRCKKKKMFRLNIGYLTDILLKLSVTFGIQSGLECSI